MGTKNSPGQFDCYGAAAPDEPMFILLARDPHAPAAVEKWAEDREFLIEIGRKPESDRPTVTEAHQCADAMRLWRKANRPAPVVPMPGHRRDFSAWADDDEGWNQDTGAPSKRLVSNAIQAWALLQNRRRISVADAAAAFNILPVRVIEAVEDHAWMYLAGPTDDYTKLLIEHDGE